MTVRRPLSVCSAFCLVWKGLGLRQPRAVGLPIQADHPAHPPDAYPTSTAANIGLSLRRSPFAAAEALPRPARDRVSEATPRRHHQAALEPAPSILTQPVGTRMARPLGPITTLCGWHLAVLKRHLPPENCVHDARKDRWVGAHVF